MCQGGPQIRNNELPACTSCIHYRPFEHTEYSSEIAECALFGEKNVLTDKILFDTVRKCRSEESKCGKEGKHYVKDPSPLIKQGRHFLIRKGPYLGMALFFAAYLFLALSINSH